MYLCSVAFILGSKDCNLVPIPWPFFPIQTLLFRADVFLSQRFETKPPDALSIKLCTETLASYPQCLVITLKNSYNYILNI